MNNKAERSLVRTQVVPLEIRGIINRPERGSLQLPFLVWDVAAKGLGVWTPESLIPGEKVVLSFGRPILQTLAGKVLWSEPAHDQGFRVGIETEADEEALAAILEFLRAQKS